MVLPKNLVHHHRYDKVVHRSQCVCAPRVIHAAALCEDRTRQQHEDWSYCFFDVPSCHSSSIAGFMVTPPLDGELPRPFPIINLYSSAEL